MEPCASGSGRGDADSAATASLCEDPAMEVMNQEQHRVLGFVAAANAGGYRPVESEVKLWLDSPVPAESSLVSVVPTGWNKHWMRIDEGIVKHLVRIQWLQKVGGGVEVTPLGKSLLRWAEAASSDAGQVVTLDHRDPLSYAVLIGELAAAGRATLVDPYLDVNGLVDVARNTSIDRVLVGERDGRKKAALTTLVDSNQGLEVDVRSRPDLHDRLLVADDGRVWTIGASLNTVSRRTAFTIMTPLPQKAAQVIGDEVRSWWGKGTPLVREGDSNESSDE